MKTLDKFAPRKWNYSRGNNMPFMNNVILMLKNVRNCRIFLSIKTRKDYYANLNVKDIVDNKKFWRTVKPIFFVKTKSNEKIT